MPLRRNKHQREARKAELDRQDREHSARPATVSAQATRPPLFCQRCEAKLKPTATACHYCGSQDLGLDQPSCPRFSEVAGDGRCPRCRGMSFTVPGLAAPMSAGEFLIGGAAGAAIGAAAGAASSDVIIVCVTCGKRFRRG
jgi:ribosomal protein L40E